MTHWSSQLDDAESEFGPVPDPTIPGCLRGALAADGSEARRERATSGDMMGMDYPKSYRLKSWASPQSQRNRSVIFFMAVAEH